MIEFYEKKLIKNLWNIKNILKNKQWSNNTDVEVHDKPHKIISNEIKY